MKKILLLLVLVFSLFVFASCGENKVDEEKTYDLSKVVFSDATYVYDGEAHSLEVIGLPEGVEVDYKGTNGKVEVGVYNVTADLSADGKLLKSLEAKLTITAQIPSIEGIKFEDKTFNYDGEAHSLEATNLPEGVSVTYEGNGKIEVGIYDVTANFIFDGNNIGSLKAKLVIAENVTKLATPSNFAFENDILTFDPVADSDSYEVSIYKSNDEQNALYYNDGLINPEVDLTELSAGSFIAKVKAFAPIGSEEYSDSDYATYEFTIASEGDLSLPTNIVIGNNGYISWECSSNCTFDIIITKLNSNEEVATSFGFTEKSYMVSACNLENGDYTFKVRSSSNRHNQQNTEYATLDFTYKNVKVFSADDIAEFSGASQSDNTGGEHGTVILQDGCALVAPTADGWGRVASPSFNIDFDKNPCVVFYIENVIGGYHCQLTWNGTLYALVNDTMKVGTFSYAINGIKTESGTKINATGIQSVVLRLGVNNSTTTTANDARVYYSAIKVVYISEYEEIEHNPEQLATPTELELNALGQVKWNGVANATHYSVVVTPTAGGDALYNKEQEGTNLDVSEYAPGTYKITVKAINKEDETYLDSEEVSYKFAVEKAVSYTASEIAAFVTGGGSAVMSYDEENDLAIYNKDGVADYGWCWPTSGCELDLTKNPLIIVYVEAITDGGYLARATYSGHGDIVMKNDTAGALGKTLIKMRANVNVDGNSIGSGTIEGYKFGFGVRGNGEAKVSKIEIVYFYKFVEQGTDPIQLDAPESIELDNLGNAKWATVENANKYEVKVSKLSDDTEVYNEIIKSAEINVAGLFEAGDYKISVKAINDSNELLLDSEITSYTFTIENVVVYTAEQIAAFVKGGGDDMTVSINADGNVVINEGGIAGWGWTWPSTGVNLDLTKNPLIVVDLASANEGGYLARAKADENSNIIMKNDTTGPFTNQLIVMRAAVNVDGNPVKDGATALTNYQFGFGVRGNGICEVREIRIVTVSTYKTRLETPEVKLTNGEISWSSIDNATGYEINIYAGAELKASIDTALLKTGKHLTLGAGTYTVKVKAVSTNELYASSNEAVIEVTVEEIAAYTPDDIVNFVKGGGDDMTVAKNEDGNVVINQGGTAGWGWSWDETGVNLDLTKNPLVVVDLVNANEGGYLARAKCAENENIIMKNDTPGPHVAQQIIMRTSVNVDVNPVKNEATSLTNYQFGFGVRGNGVCEVSGIYIVTCTEVLD